jgi:hypothetical protein
MKSTQIGLGIIALGLAAFAIGDCYFAGSLRFLKLDTNPKISVNGAAVPGELLVGQTTAVVTVRDTDKAHSYQLFFEGDTDFTGDMGSLVDCGAWA